MNVSHKIQVGFWWDLVSREGMIIGRTSSNLGVIRIQIRIGDPYPGIQINVSQILTPPFSLTFETIQGWEETKSWQNIGRSYCWIEKRRSCISTTGLRSRISEGPRAFAGSALSECHFLVHFKTVLFISRKRSQNQFCFLYSSGHVNWKIVENVSKNR